MNALIASQTIRSLRSGIVTGLGAMSADLVLGAVVYALRSEVDVGAVVRGAYALGAVVMIVLGIRVLARASEQAPPEASAIRTYSQAVGVGLSNPFQIVWWFTAGLAFAYLGGLILLVGLFGAVLAWVLAFPYALRKGTERRPELGRAVVYASSALMFAFAIYFVLLAV
jgi:threonine/homoserine/homoserine lactone efflux protein